MSSPWVRIAEVPHTVRPDGARVLAGVGEVPGEQRVGERQADLPGVARRDGLRVDGVEVAAGRQHVDQAAGRRAGRPGRDVAAVERVQHVVDLVGGARPAAARPRRTRTPARATTSGDGLAQHLGARPAAALAAQPRRRPCRRRAGAATRLQQRRRRRRGRLAGQARRRARSARRARVAGCRLAHRAAASSACSSRPVHAASAARRPGQRAAAAAPDLRGAQHASTRLTRGLAGRARRPGCAARRGSATSLISHR